MPNNYRNKWENNSITNVLENVQEPEAIDVSPEKNPNNLKVLK